MFAIDKILSLCLSKINDPQHNERNYNKKTNQKKAKAFQ